MVPGSARNWIEVNAIKQPNLNKKMKTKNMTTLQLRESSGPATAGRGFLLIPLVLACFALSPMARAVSPAPDGGYPNDNTAEGNGALFNLTSGHDNTATGNIALLANTTGSLNTATGSFALQKNTTGNDNTGLGFGTIFQNTTGSFNTATGVNALQQNTTGNENTANGLAALFNNTTGSFNTATGLQALVSNTTGNSNIAVGFNAGLNLTTGSNNIDIGNLGVAGEANKIRIGTKGTQKQTFVAGISGATVAGGVGVIVNSNGQLGTVTSSERFKDAIKPMDKASEAILALKPVTFRYKHELDPDGIPQFGLVAEQVEKVNPDLVARDDTGKVYTVRYEAVNAMLLNEFLKAHRKAQQQEATVTQLKSAMVQQRKDFEATTALQQKEIQVLTASIKEQAAQIQKVSARLEVSKPAPQVVVNNQ
jgi:hypothetical protein